MSVYLFLEPYCFYPRPVNPSVNHVLFCRPRSLSVLPRRPVVDTSDDAKLDSVVTVLPRRALYYKYTL